MDEEFDYDTRVDLSAPATDPSHDQSATPRSKLKQTHIALREDVREASVDGLNQLLIDTVMLRDLYKKHHWQSSGPTFYQLHLLCDAHFAAQSELVDQLAERVQTLGGTAIAMPNDVAELTHIEHPPTEREAPTAQIKRLLDAHKVLLGYAHEVAEKAGETGDHGTEDLVVSSLIATNEKQSWFLSEHLN